MLCAIELLVEWSDVVESTDVRVSYDAAAAEYARHLFAELEHKPLDRHLLNRFAESVTGKGLVADVGCGPGHVAQYLHDRGVSVLGVDLSPGMVEQARHLCSGPHFVVGDMRLLDLPDASLVGIVALYSIVHFDHSELRTSFHEFRRVLAADGLVLLAFHIGDKIEHVDDLWGCPVSLDFHFHSPAEVVAALAAENLAAIEASERDPYEGHEYPSRRCYLLAKAT